MQIGLDNIVYAKITEDANGNEVYGTPKKLAKAMSSDISVSSDGTVLYADDGADLSLNYFTSGTLKLGVNKLTNAVLADLLGQRIDSNGAIISSGEDQAPPVAIGFRSLKAKGGYRYTWLYRVQFGIPGESLKTKGEKIEIQTPTIEGTISRRNKPDADGNHPWRANIDEGDGGSSMAIRSWFNSVYEPGATAEDTYLSVLMIGSEDLTPDFASATTEYTCETSESTLEIDAEAQDSGAAVAIIVNGNSIASGDEATINAGDNTVFITVTAASGAQRTYTVVVTKTTSNEALDLLQQGGGN